ncbi:unnamed protein product [Urochloa humidicola]
MRAPALRPGRVNPPRIGPWRALAEDGGGRGGMVPRRHQRQRRWLRWRKRSHAARGRAHRLVLPEPEGARRPLQEARHRHEGVHPAPRHRCLGGRGRGPPRRRRCLAAPRRRTHGRELVRAELAVREHHARRRRLAVAHRGAELEACVRRRRRPRRRQQQRRVLLYKGAVGGHARQTRADRARSTGGSRCSTARSRSTGRRASIASASASGACSISSTNLAAAAAPSASPCSATRSLSTAAAPR